MAAPAKVREYPINLFKVESLVLGLGFWGLNSHRPIQNPIFGGAPEKTPVGGAWYQIKTLVRVTGNSTL